MESTWPPEHRHGEVEIEAMGVRDAARVTEAAHLFDTAPAPAAMERFLLDPNHHLLIAYSARMPVGFVSGVEVTHPDKGTEMFLYELAVDQHHRHRGIGTALVNALAELARSRDCYGMWVLTEDENAAASATYAKAGGEVESQPLMFSWKF